MSAFSEEELRQLAIEGRDLARQLAGRIKPMRGNSLGPTYELIIAGKDERIAELTKRLDRLALALSPTSMEKEAIADQITWRSSKTDFVTDVIAILRARAGIDDRLREMK